MGAVAPRGEMADQNAADHPASLRLGSRLLENAYSLDGTLLLRAGAQITTMAKLARLSQPDVRFGESRSTEIPLDTGNEAVLDVVEAGQDREVQEFRQRLGKATQVKSGAVDRIEGIFDTIGAGDVIDLDTAQSAVSVLLDDLLDDPRALVSLSQVKNADLYTYTHCVNVAILTMHLAMHAGYRDEIEEIGVGALLHDVGKAHIPIEVLNKPGPLTASEFALMRKHPDLGHEQVLKAGEKRQIVTSCVLSHHEKVSGKGYPHGKRGRLLCPYAMMTSIADIYDAFTTDRPYHLALTPKDTLTLMARNFRNDLREDLLECFVSIIGFYPVGSKVELSNSYVGQVLRHYASRPNDPAVVLTHNAQGESISGSTVIELADEPDLFIRQFVSQNRYFSTGMGESNRNAA